MNALARLHAYLLNMWNTAEEEGDEDSVRAAKRCLDILRLPWVRT